MVPIFNVYWGMKQKLAELVWTSLCI